MAIVPDNKKGWSFIKKMQTVINDLESSDDDLQDLKTKWIAESPSIGSDGFPMSGAEVAQANAMLEAFHTFITVDHAATITMLKSKNVGSHKGNALD
jgi:hypothetical protein